MPVWCQDEAGPYQAIPQPGASWQPEERPACQPHEYIRGGTATLLTLVHPATGAVRGTGVTSAPNAVLHPWLRHELTQILDALPEPPAGVPADLPPLRRWDTWLDEVPEGLPPLRLLLVWDNLAGHKSHALVAWLLAHGVAPLYTPLSGSWLTMAKSIQRILVARALDGQHPENGQAIIDWIEATIRGWNRAPTPFTWGGKRHERRLRARARRLAGSGATIPYATSIAA
ncbi:MAG: transposase [Chloroflexi bacterium]|nr:transposase [Chloroflexota bacterium]